MTDKQQNEIVQKAALLDEKGYLSVSGYAKRLLLDYDRSRIRSRKSRLWEWDRYLIFDKGFLIDIGFVSNTRISYCMVTYADLSQPRIKTTGMPIFFAQDSFVLPDDDWDSSFQYRDGRLKTCTVANLRERRVDLEMHNFEFGTSLTARLAMMDEPPESIVSAVPYDTKGQLFCYSQKIVGLRAQGTVSTRTGTHAFDPDETFAIIDRGRGLLPRKRERSLACGCTMQSGELVGFNVAAGSGDSASVNENMIFVNGIGHKIGTVSFIEEQNEEAGALMSAWRLSCEDERFDLQFKPLVRDVYKKNLIFASGSKHSMFGSYSGTLCCDDGRAIEIDECYGILEKRLGRF